jgi:FMN reductase
LLERREPAYLSGKVIGLMSTAGGVPGLQAINTMEFIVRVLRGCAVPLVLAIARAWQVFASSATSCRDVLKQLLGLGREVARSSAQMRREGTCDYAEMLPGSPASA